MLSPGEVAPAPARPPHAPHAHAPRGGAAPRPRGHLAATCPAHGGGPGEDLLDAPGLWRESLGPGHSRVSHKDPRRTPPSPDPPRRGSWGTDKPHSQGIRINSAIFGEPWAKWKFKKKKKTFLKEKRGEKKSLLLMSFIISIESVLPVWRRSGNPASHTDLHQTPSYPPHTFQTHRSACWLYQTLLLLPAEIDLKNKQF